MRCSLVHFYFETVTGELFCDKGEFAISILSICRGGGGRCSTRTINIYDDNHLIFYLRNYFMAHGS